MPKNPEIPLHLFEVLEEEFISMHGPIPRGYPSGPSAKDEVLVVELTDKDGTTRFVEAARDWWFRRGHVKDPVGLVSEILQFSDGSAPAPARSVEGKAQDEWARNNLTQYMRDNIDRKLLTRLVEPCADREDASRETIEGALNRLLTDSELYDGDRFADDWLSPATRGLVEQRAAAGGFFGDALKHFNRLLLEEAFPDYIERMSNIRLAAIYRRLHAQEQSALCLSGGGIRSGTFALGLFQGLAQHDLLKRFDYLSTVSGGGYIGSWLTAWLHRHPGGIEGVTRDLTNANPVRKIDPDPRPIQYLRSFSNFITPKVGLLTADTWTFAGIYLRNLVLNWLVFIPLLMAALMIPRLVVNLTLLQPVEDAPASLAAHIREREYRELHPQATDEEIKTNVQKLLDEDERAKKLEYRQTHPDVTDEQKVKEGAQGLLAAELEGTVEKLKEVPRESRIVYEPKPWVWNLFGQGRHLFPRHVLLFVGFLLGVWSLGFIGFNRPGVREMLRERSRFWRTRTNQRGFLLYCLLPLLVAAACLTTYWAWSSEMPTEAKDVTRFLVFGLLFTLAGWLIASSVLRRIFHLSELNWGELFGLLVAGLVGGLIFWAVSFSGIKIPVIGYGVLPREQLGAVKPWVVAQSPLAWTDWTSWTWSSWTTEVYVCVALPIFLLVFWAGTTFVVGLTSRSTRFSDDDREWWARLGAWLLIASIAWFVFNALVVFGPLALLESPKLLATIGGLSGLVSILVGRSALTPAAGKSSTDKEQTKSAFAFSLLGVVVPVLGSIFLAAFVALVSLATTGLTRGVAIVGDESQCELTGANSSPTCKRFDSRILEWFTNVPGQDPKGYPPPRPDLSANELNKGFRDYIAYVTPVVTFAPTPMPSPSQTPEAAATPCTALCLSPAELAAQREAEDAKRKDPFNGAKVVHMNVLHHTSLWLTLALALVALAIGSLLARLINLNIFSLHGGYRDRLIRAFLGASRPYGSRRPNPFTGFDPADDLHMHELRPALLDEGDFPKQRKLAEALLDETNALSKYFAEMYKQEERKRNEGDETGASWLRLVRELAKSGPLLPSPALSKALRTDLNTILEEERLYALDLAIPILKQSKRAAKIWQRFLTEVGVARPGVADLKLEDADLKRLSISMRSDYHILLNRLVLEGAYPRLLRPCEFPPPPYKLMHVINTTLNLVGGQNLAWQQRKAEPFSVSPLHSGCFRLGYRKSRDYGGRDQGGITLGTAAATSGAAASSNMGYYTTSPVISLLLTLFNVRLGWWLGNPGPAGDDTYQLAAPKYSVSPVISEAFGLTDDRNPYVYLTDGGHFENLAIYEMVLRRCRFVVASDAAADEEYHFSDLANAVRKIRIDLGVTIDFPYVGIYDKSEADSGRGPGMYWALGRIRYGCVDRVRPGDGPRGLAPDDDIPRGCTTPYPLFGAEDLKDPLGLLVKLAHRNDSLSNYIVGFVEEQLPPELKSELNDAERTGSPSQSLQDALRETFNNLLRGPSLYTADRFPDVNKLSAKTRILIKRKPQGDELVRLNRLLLEEAYPGDVPNRYFEDADDGILLYIKPAVYGNEPRDVLEYKESFPSFPHQSTADQFFDEPQFESYRELGYHIMKELCGSNDDEKDGYKSLVLLEMFQRARDELERHVASPGKETARDARLSAFLDGLDEWLKSRPEAKGVQEKTQPDASAQEETQPDKGLAAFLGWVAEWLGRREEWQKAAEAQKDEGRSEDSSRGKSEGGKSEGGEEPPTVET